MTKWGVILVSTVRCLLFAILAAAFVPAIAIPPPRSGTIEDFLRDVRNGHADAISIPPTSGWLDPSDGTDVTWRTGFADWYQASYSVYGPDYHDTATFPDGVASVEGSAIEVPQGVARDQLIAVAQAASTAGGHGTLHLSDHMELSEITHLEPSPAPPAILAAFVAWLVLSTFAWGAHPGAYATRGAWVWLFTLGVIGPFLYLWKEPAPPRFRPNPRKQPPRAPITALGGFLRASGCAIAAIVVAEAVSSLR